MDNQKIHNKFTIRMQKKLVVLFLVILLAFMGLSYRLFAITRDSGEKYKKQVLSQQRYDSITIPSKRGSILDANGSVLAASEKVYNVILDSVALAQNEECLQPTLDALKSQLGIDPGPVKTYYEENKQISRYYVLDKRLEYEKIEKFKEMQSAEDSQIKGIWFEEEYKRVYPGNTLACDVIGFTTNDNTGTYGLEEYYNNILSGTSGREYGYLNDDSNLERTTIPAEDGNTIVTTIDANIQSIVEKHLKKFDEEYKNNAHEGNGANNLGCIIMDVNSGEILSMASYPVFDLNDTRNPEALEGLRMLDAEGKKTDQYINADNVGTLEGDTLYQNLNSLWKNFCINDTYEPGSVSKPFTVAAGIESGSITGNESYNCEGMLHVADKDIKCHRTTGDGYITVTQGIERSCNVCMMYVALATGAKTFTKFQHIFNFGLKTNIDLAGESRTASLLYTADNMGPADLATNSFGQNYNATMIQMISGFCSLINGGKYYEPHMVSKIVSSSGATVQNIEPRVLRETVSATTSAKIREMCNQVVAGENGTGKTARPAGYMIGGKTGTAETHPRGNYEYVLSFMGYAPANDPQIAIYVVVDRPNVPGYIMDDAKYATRLVRSILTEVLPYKGIFMTEELSDKERAELEELQIEIMTPIEPVPEETTENVPQEGAENTDSNATPQPDGTDSTQASPGPKAQEWKEFPIDPVTGYAVNPKTGEYVDPDTGLSVGGSFDGSIVPTTGNGTAQESTADTANSSGDVKSEN